MYLELITKQLEELEKNHLARKLIEFNFKEKKNFHQSNQIRDFASNDYFGLTHNKKIKLAYISAVKKFGTGGRSSPLVFAYSNAHQSLSNELKRKLGKQKVLLFSSAYSANIGSISALGSIGSISQKRLIFQDKLNHASLLDGAKLATGEMIRFKHLDYEHLIKRLEQKKAKQYPTLIISDSVFSMDGDQANIDELIAIKKKYQALLMIDDAHGFAMSHQVNARQLKDIDLYSASFAKALGGNGAFVATSEKIADFLINKARSFIYSTAINPALCQVALASLKLIEQDSSYQKKLDENINYFKTCAKKNKLNLMDSNSPIQPVLIGDSKQCLDISENLFKQGFSVGAIRSPTVLFHTERLRISIHSNQKKSEIKALCQLIAKSFNQFNK